MDWRQGNFVSSNILFQQQQMVYKRQFSRDLQVFQVNLDLRGRGAKRAVEESKENQDLQDRLEREVSREPLEDLEYQD